ncbi:MAG TPA: 3-hydroxyacyl-CoA dehydrogenase family protein [Candidatus Thermoplasmatota archaeon]
MEPVCILGAGTMGRGIAQVCAQAGHPVRLRDMTMEILEKSRAAIHQALDKGVQLGKVQAADATTTLQRIVLHTDLASAARGAKWVIEAVPEDVALKQRVLQEAETHLDTDAILATNTSSLSIGLIAHTLARPTHFVGLHFFNPPHLLKLLEVVRGPKTDPGVVDAAVGFARHLGKDPIVVKDSPGFASSRLGLALGLEAIRMLEEGVASAADIDKAMELGYNHPMGPLKLTDLVGLDVRLAIAEHLAKTLNDARFQPPELLRRMVKEGKLGKKTGQGFYSYK